jgi:hypothetical protein
MLTLHDSVVVGNRHLCPESSGTTARIYQCALDVCMHIRMYVLYCTYIGIDLPTYRDSVHGALLASVKYVLYVCTRQKRLG